MWTYIPCGLMFHPQIGIASSYDYSVCINPFLDLLDPKEAVLPTDWYCIALFNYRTSSPIKPHNLHLLEMKQEQLSFIHSKNYKICYAQMIDL